MKKSIALISVLIFSFSQSAFSFQWGSGFNEGDLRLKKFSTVFHEVDETPATPEADEIRLYAKDNGGTTTLYSLNSGGSPTAIGGGSGSPGGSDTQVQYNDSSSFGGDAGMTYNETTNILTVTGGLTAGASATPSIVLKDSDAADGDDNIKILGGCTDTGSGTEDCDITVQQQINGTLTTAMTFDADGLITAARDLAVPSEAYNATNWNANTEAPQKDAIRDQIEVMPQTAGRSLTLTGVDVLADAELYTHTICYRTVDPTASTDDKSVWLNNTANQFTVTKLWCESDQTTTAMLQVDDGSAADMDSVDLSCTSTPATDTSLNGDATIAAGDRIDLDVASVSGTPTWVSICFTGTWDD